jgi:hypothetical protein
MKKKILILRACGSEGEQEECDIIKSQSKLYGFDVDDRCLKTNNELKAILQPKPKPLYDFIYLSSHGNSYGFGNNKRNGIYCSWDDFGSLLCNAACMKDDCKVLLSCCRGGLDKVAYTLFYHCGQISYIVGPRQDLLPLEMAISYNILLFNLKHRGIDPIVACEKIKAVTDIRFICFDRLEVETRTDYLLFIESLTNKEI